MENHRGTVTVSDLSAPDWNAKILKALKENSRRFAKGAIQKKTSKRAIAKVWTSQLHDEIAAKLSTLGEPVRPA